MTSGTVLTSGTALTGSPVRTSSRVRVGVVGCGEVTQILHLPSLRQLSDLFEVTALCDSSPQVLAGVGDLWGITARFGNYQDMLYQSNVDVVLVANPHAYHSEVVLAALATGKHVLAEKPLCITLSEADAIIAAQQETGLTVQVGTMRRYADAFIHACKLVRELPEIRLARVHDVIGHNHLFIQHSSRVLRPSDVPQEIVRAGRELERQRIEEAIGTDDPDLHNAYLLMLGLSSHDLSAMRELLGRPQGVLYAAQRAKGSYITAAFDYGDYVCHFETGNNSVADFDAYLSVYSSERIIKVKYDTPYVRNLPIRLEITEMDSENASSRRVLHPEWNDPFVAEWRAFYESVTTGAPSKTDSVDFRQDLELFGEMIEQMK